MGRQEPDAAKSTSDRILEAAEICFATKGIRATTLKEITELADVNIAAVNYHFGSKDELVRAVYERSFRPLNEDRLRLLEKVEARADGAGITLEDVLRALFEPMIRAWTTNRNFILLVGRLQHEPDAELNGYIQGQLYSELVRRFLAAARKAAPDIPEADLFFWIHFLFGGTVYTLFNSQDMERLHAGRNLLDCPDVFLDVLISFGAAGLRSRRIPIATEK
ncbi:MAG: TetR/AcrR family transcriptional regulator [Acidobacteriota bacterium]